MSQENYVSDCVSLLRCVNRVTRMPTINPFNPEFTIVIFLNYKPRIAAAILDL